MLRAMLWPGQPPSAHRLRAENLLFLFRRAGIERRRMTQSDDRAGRAIVDAGARGWRVVRHGCQFRTMAGQYPRQKAVFLGAIIQQIRTRHEHDRNNRKRKSHALEA